MVNDVVACGYALESALVLDVNVDVFTTDVFENLDGVEESMTSCSVLSPVVSRN